ncbi:hypothetical protein LOK49_Contig146G00001 [Camellia lanceoleosa]|nr:hypothetical protein LOK49_Contig146G00001 [Camellia lanceoleosa]
MLRLASPPPQPPSSSSTSSNSLRMNMESTRNSEGSFHGENTNSSQQKDNLEVHGQWNQNGEAAPLTAEKVRSAAKAGLATAATKAKLSDDLQAKKSKRKHFIEGISCRINCHLWGKEWKNNCTVTLSPGQEHKVEGLASHRASQILWVTVTLSEPIPNGFYSIVAERRLKELFDSIPSLDELHALYSEGLGADVIVVDNKDKKLSMLKQLTVTLVKGLNSNPAAVIKKDSWIGLE